MNTISSLRTALLFSILTITAMCAGAAEPVRKHRLLLFEYGSGPNRMVELDADGKMVWEHAPPGIAVIFEVLPNGNVLYAYGGKPTGVREVTRTGKEVWNYVSKCPQVLGCSRLPNGNTLVGEQGPCRAVEVKMAAVPATKTKKEKSQPEKLSYSIPDEWLDAKRREETVQSYLERFPELNREEALKQLEEWGF